jgi:hypothetical protein
MTATTSFDHLLGVDGQIGSVWLDGTVLALSLRSLHSLVLTAGLTEFSHAKRWFLKVLELFLGEH